MRKLALVFVLMAWVVSAQASVTTTGDVDPGGAGTQPDPWAVGNPLHVGKTGTGTLNVEAGGMVSNLNGYLGYNSRSTGASTVSGAGSG